MPIKSIERWVLGSGLVISAILFLFSVPLRAGLEDWLTKQLHLPSYMSLVALFLVALSLLFLAGKIPQHIFQYRPPRRLIMKNRFIEGTWLDAVFDAHDDQHEVKHVGIIDFIYEKGYLKVKANDYEPSGRWRSGFFSIFGAMNDSNMYQYCWERQRPAADDKYGYAEYSFLVARGEVKKFTGNYTSVTRGTENEIEGDKLTPDLLRILKVGSVTFDQSRDDDRNTLIKNYSKYKTEMRRNGR